MLAEEARLAKEQFEELKKNPAFKLYKEIIKLCPRRNGLTCDLCIAKHGDNSLSSFFTSPRGGKVTMQAVRAHVGIVAHVVAAGEAEKIAAKKAAAKAKPLPAGQQTIVQAAAKVVDKTEPLIKKLYRICYDVIQGEEVS